MPTCRVCIVVSQAVNHAGMKCRATEITLATVEYLRITQYGRWTPVEQAAEQFERSQQKILADIDARMAELQQMRVQIAAVNFPGLPERGFITVPEQATDA